MTLKDVVDAEWGAQLRIRSMIHKLLRKIRGGNKAPRGGNKTSNLDIHQLNQTELDIYRSVIAHEECMPTRKELAYMNPSMGQEEMIEALTELLIGGIIRSTDTLDRGYWRFYALTRYGAEKAPEVVTDIGAFRDDYQFRERTDDLQRLEGIERPPTEEVGGVYVPKDYDTI